MRCDINQEYDAGNTYEFVGRAFLYSLTRKNDANHKPRKSKANEKLSLEEVIQGIQGVFAKFPKPIVIKVPDELDASEMCYVNIYGY